jgi:hypothetical protein
VQTRRPFEDESLGRLYSDYRRDSYNNERIRYEPSYASIADLVGKSPQEISFRVKGLTNWLASKIDSSGDFSLLDYGGADGRFLPNLNGRKYVFEISNISPIEGVVRLDSGTMLESYSYIQMSHLLEHVSFPLALVKKLSSKLKPRGYLYVEVPCECGDTIRRLVEGEKNLYMPIHEHINFYGTAAITTLIEMAGLEVIAVEAEPSDIGWSKGTIIRGLGQQTRNWE